MTVARLLPSVLFTGAMPLSSSIPNPCRFALVLFLAMGAVFVPRAWAQSDGGIPDANEAPPALTPPSLKTHREAIYPAQALAERREGNVGLELDLDASGQVAEVRVVAPAGHGLDEAAMDAARAFNFEPARRRGVPVASTVDRPPAAGLRTVGSRTLTVGTRTRSLFAGTLR